MFCGLSDEMAPDAAQARLQTTGRTDILCVGLDGNPNAKEAIKHGDLIATLRQARSPLARTPSRRSSRPCGETMGNKSIEADISAADSSNVGPFLKYTGFAFRAISI